MGGPDVQQTDLITINIQGLYPKSNQSKVPFLKDIVQQYNVKFLTLTETHLKPEILDSEIHVEGYAPFRSDRTNRSHGGVITYVHNSLPCIQQLSYSNQYCSVVIVKATKLNLVLITVYRPPNCPKEAFQETINKCNEIIKHQALPTPDIILLGDFNFPHMKWPSGKILAGSTKEEQEQAKLLLNEASNNFMNQIILKPTRKNNILDLVFSNNPSLVHHYEVVPTIISDHNIINIFLNYVHEEPPMEDICEKPTLAKFDYSKANWDEMNKTLNEADWQTLMKNRGPNQMFKIFLETIETACIKNIPMKSDCRLKRCKIPRKRRILMRKRTKLNKQLTTAISSKDNQQILLKLHNIENQLIRSYDLDRELEETNAVEEIKVNPKYFYSFAAKYSKIKSTVGPFIDENNKCVNDPKIMAEMLNRQYHNMFSEPKLDKFVHDAKAFFQNVDRSRPTLEDFDFTPGDIIKAIDRVSSNAAPGPEAFSAKLLKECKQSLAKPLYIIWRMSLDTGQIPWILKQAIITPVHKGESRALPKNYRPVSLTSHLTKTFERVIRSRLVGFLEENNLFNDTQHGFRAGRSCLSQLLEHCDNILSELEKGNNIDVIYLDFAKAFDKVDHGILCHKLKSLGIGGRVGRWIHNFLKGRTQTVATNGTKSILLNVLSSVPQGTVLGPILFLILLIDIDRNIISNVSSFADDTRISHGIASTEDAAQLQSDLQTVYGWQHENNMLFNEKKFELLRYGKNQDIKEATNYIGPLKNQIQEKQSVRDLGIMINNTMTFTDHITKVCNKAKQICGWIQRTFKTRDKEIMRTLWNSLVQPHLDYCSQLWAPHKIGEIQKLEAIQRQYTSKIPVLSEQNYWERLKTLKLNSQERRMERYRIIYVWKILEDKVPNPGITHHMSQRKGRLCKIPKIEQQASCAVKTIKEGSFMVRGPNLFNSMPQNIRNKSDCSTDSFKHQLDNYLRTIPDLPRIPGYTNLTITETNSLLEMTKLPSMTTASATHDDHGGN